MQLAKYLLETANKNYGTNSPISQKAKTASNQNAILQLVGKSLFTSKLRC
jgi:hypothetical protein